MLGWEPRIDLEAGLKLSLLYFQQAVARESLGSDGLTVQFRLQFNFFKFLPKRLLQALDSKPSSQNEKFPF